MKLLRRIRTLLGASFATLCHEWLPTLCLVTALAAVLCPVILILGLKNGTVENLRQSLLRDPATLELRPRSSYQVDDELLKKIRSIDGVDFVVPKTRSLGSASVEFEFDGRRVDADLIPTAEGDPLLRVYGSSQPSFGEAVLTAAASKALGVKAGDRTVMMLSRRNAEGMSETVSLPLHVNGVLPEEATTIRAAYVQLDLLGAVEEYRENLAVPRLGWLGPDNQVAEPVFDGFLAVTKEEISDSVISRISIATGFLSHRRINSDDADAEFKNAVDSNLQAILFFNENNPRSQSSFHTISEIIGDSLNSVHPWVKPSEIRIKTPFVVSESMQLHTLLTHQHIREKMKNESLWIATPHENEYDVATLIVKSPVSECEFPIKLVVIPDGESERVAYGPPELTGILRHLNDRHMDWDPINKRFLLGRRSYSSFRLYADSLDSVTQLADELQKIGIECASESARIAKVLKFDQDLSKLFWFVSAFSLAGGGAALTMSLYGAIERRKRDYAMLRMLGLPRAWLLFMPLLEAIVITLLAFITALLVYHACSSLINRMFSHFDDDRPGFCHLPMRLQGMVLAWSMLLATLGAIGAGIRLLFISPSEAIRHAN